MTGAHETELSTKERLRLDLLNSLFGEDVPTGLDGPLLRTADVAVLFQVSERTVSEWARRGRIPSVRTPGGHRRYPAEEIERLLRAAERGELPEPTHAPRASQTEVRTAWPSSA